jgi:hypothetical protein
MATLSHGTLLNNGALPRLGRYTATSRRNVASQWSVILLLQVTREKGVSMEGLWTVEFGSTTGRFGGGVVVFHEGRVMGGDNSYFYLGTFTVVRPNEFTATLDVTPFIDGVESVFNTLGRNLKLNLTGTLVDEAHATAQGYPISMPQLKLGVKLTKRS